VVCPAFGLPTPIGALVAQLFRADIGRADRDAGASGQDDGEEDEVGSHLVDTPRALVPVGPVVGEGDRVVRAGREVPGELEVVAVREGQDIIEDQSDDGPRL